MTQTPVVEQEPAFAGDLFGERIVLARRFAENLAERGELLGLIGPQEPERLWTRHIANSALLTPLITGETVADVGSGGGFPGLVLAIARPQVHFTLIEPMERRCEWLNAQINDLELENVTVKNARAEDVVGTLMVDQVTARAVSALRTLVPITAPLAKDGGELVLLKGINAANEISAAEKALKKYRVTNVRVIELGENYGTEITRVVRADVRQPAKETTA